MSDTDLNQELTHLTLQLLSLSQQLVTSKLRLEDVTKTGWMLMAKARFVSPAGGGCISMTQVPGDNLEAGVRVEARECVQDTKVRYHHHNLVTHVSDDDEEGVRRRKGEKEEDDDTDKKEKKSKTAKDPLKWFGVLSPPSLRQSQV